MNGLSGSNVNNTAYNMYKIMFLFLVHMYYVKVTVRGLLKRCFNLVMVTNIFFVIIILVANHLSK